MRAQYGYDKPGTEISQVIQLARSKGIPDVDLNLILTDAKNIQQAKSQGFMGGVAQQLHQALGLAKQASPVVRGAVDGAQRVGQVIDTGIQNLQGAGQQIKTGAQNIGQAFTSPDTYVNENGVSVPSGGGGRDMMNRVSQAGMGIMDVASGAGQAALTPYIAPLGAVKQELGAAAEGYSEAWKALPEKVKIVLKNVPVSPMTPGLSWGDAINQINSLPNDIKEVVMEGITAISGAATVPTTIEMGKKAFNAADTAMKNYKVGDTITVGRGVMSNEGGEKMIVESIVPADETYMKRIYLRDPNANPNSSMSRYMVTDDNIKSPLSQGIDKVKGAVKGLANDVKGEAVMPTAGMGGGDNIDDIAKQFGGFKNSDGVYRFQNGKSGNKFLVELKDKGIIKNYNEADVKDIGQGLLAGQDIKLPSLGGELQLPKRLQSLKTGDVVNIKGELATVTGSSSKGLEVEFFSDGSKNTVVKFDSVAKAGAKEVAKVAKGGTLKMPNLKK